MSKELEKRCIIEVLRDRYRRSRKKEKGVIIGELCDRLKVGRKHAIRLLRAKSPGRPRKPDGRGRPSKYRDHEFIQALKLVWKLLDYRCGRVLKEAIPDWLKPIEKQLGAFPLEIREKLLAISPPTIDRVLKPFRAIRGRGFTRNSGFRNEIPIQENIWDISIPGYVEADTVAHCGGSTYGEYINTLTVVDIATIWTEARAMFGRGSNPAFDALRDIEFCLPFSILGYDADNGGEVLNKQILSYFRDERVALGLHPVQVTRSREYKKNDNAHVEQRNDSIARRYLGYERLGFQQLAPLINYYYAKVVCPMINHFIPSFKLKQKLKVKSRIRRIYDKPATPFSRVMQSANVSQERKLKLQAEHDALNPLTLHNQERVLRKLIDQTCKALAAGAKSPIGPSYQLVTNFLNPQQNNVKFLQVSR